MAKRLTKQVAAKLLADVDPNKYFYVSNGPTIKNIGELYSAVSQMNDEQFSYHRNNAKNDFYNWIRQVVGDVRLANEIVRVKTKNITLKRIEKRLTELNTISNGGN